MTRKGTNKQMSDITTSVDNLAAEIEKLKTVDESVRAFISKNNQLVKDLTAQIDANSAENIAVKAKLEEFTATVDAEAGNLAAAVSANT